jgi:hypothetical protein
MSTVPSSSEWEVPVQADERTNRWTSGPAIVLYVAALMFLIEMLVASRYGFHVDELYFLACSEHLAWGYIDQPPLIVFLAYLARHLFGESLLALRLLPALSAALLVWTVGSITRELGGRRFAQVLSAIAVLVTPAYLAFHHLLTMNAFEPTLWAGCAYFAVRAVKRNAPNNWLWAGVIAGLGLENKYTISVFLFGMVVGLIFTPGERWLRTWQLWAGAALAMVIFAPNLLWETVHNFPFLQWQRTIRETPGGAQTFNFAVSDFLVKQVMLTLPVVFLWIIGLWFFLISARGKQFRFLGFAILVVLGVSLRSGKPWYAIPIYAIAFTGGSIAVEGFTDRFDRRWLRSVFVVAIVAAGMILAPCFIPILPVERFVPYQRSLHLPLPVRSESYEMESELPGFLAWEFGWDEMVAAVAQVYNALPENEKPKVGIFTSSYGPAGAINLLGKKYGLPKATCGQLSFHDFGPRDYTGEVMIFVEFKPSVLAQNCSSVQLGASLENPNGYSGQRGPIINVCRGLLWDLQQNWPTLKHY